MKLPYKGGGVALFQKSKDTNDYSIFLGKRLNGPGKGKWSIPGGAYEFGDRNLSETALREFREETELNTSILFQDSAPLVYNVNIPFIFRWSTLLFLLKDDRDLKIKKFHEFSEMKQISLKELKNYKLAFGVKGEVKAFKRKIKSEV